MARVIYDDPERLFINRSAQDAGDDRMDVVQTNHGVYLSRAVLEQLYVRLRGEGSAYADGVQVAIHRVEALYDAIERRKNRLEEPDDDDE